MSHPLHSSTLARLGLAAAVASFCKEFTAQQGTQVTFPHNKVPRSVSPDIALCLFRIVQEGLRNVQKHSGVTSAQVSIEGSDDAVHLSLCDYGKGFDIKAASAGQGRGLWSMREQVRLVGGRFKSHSEKQKGTRTEVWTPIKLDSDAIRSEPAAGPATVSVAASTPGVG